MNNVLSFFADENIPTELIEWIRNNGYEVTGVKAEKMFGISDADIIENCYSSEQIIITQDNDFGKIIFTKSVPFFFDYLSSSRAFGCRFPRPNFKKYSQKERIDYRRDTYYRF